jgi:hypothetical protein
MSEFVQVSRDEFQNFLTPELNGVPVSGTRISAMQYFDGSGKVVAYSAYTSRIPIYFVLKN